MSAWPFLLWLLLLQRIWPSSAQSHQTYGGEQTFNTDEDECPEASQGHRSTFLWSLDAAWRSAPAFLFGTIHVPYDRVWGHVPDRVKQAFESADSVVFELALQKPETVDRLMQCKQLPSAQGSLRQHLPSALFHRLKAYMHRLRQRLLRLGKESNPNSRAEVRHQVRRLFPADWEQRKPVWLLFLLFQLGDSPPRLQQQKASAAPMLDLFLAQLALDQGKALLSMETAAEQCQPLQSVRPEQVLFAINYTLGYLEWAEAKRATTATDSGGRNTADDWGPAPVDRLVSHYRCGTLGTGLEKLVFGARRFAQSGFTASPEQDQQARQVDNLLVEDILLRRNERMARRADLVLREHPDRVFFFALGAGHFLGEHSLLSQLRQLGYWVTPIAADDGEVVAPGTLGEADQRQPPQSPSEDSGGGGLLLFPALPRVGIQLRELGHVNGATTKVKTALLATLPALLALCCCCWLRLT